MHIYGYTWRFNIKCVRFNWVDGHRQDYIYYILYIIYLFKWYSCCIYKCFNVVRAYNLHIIVVWYKPRCARRMKNIRQQRVYCEWNKRRFALCACPLPRWCYYVGMSKKKNNNTYIIKIETHGHVSIFLVNGEKKKNSAEPIVEQPIWIIYFLRWTNKWMWNMPVLLCMYRYTRSHKSDGFFPSFPTSIYLFFYELFVFLPPQLIPSRTLSLALYIYYFFF